MLLASEVVTPPTTKIIKSGWWVGCGRAELMNKLNERTINNNTLANTVINV